MAVPHIINADTLFNRVINPPEFVNLPICLPIKAREKNHIQDTIMQANVNPSFSIPEYEIELVPITPIVSIMAWGLSKETDIAKTICFLEVNAFSFDELETGWLFQVVYTINIRKITPTVKRINLIQYTPKTMTDTPNTAKEIRRVSQMDAVRITGNALLNFG